MSRAKDYLRQVPLLDSKIQSRLEELTNMRSNIFGTRAISYDSDPVQSSGVPDSMADAVAKYIDLEKEINESVDELIDLKHKIVGEIEQLSDPRHVRLLNLRYVQCKTFEQIAVDTNYSFRQVLRLHGSALQEFESVIMS